MELDLRPHQAEVIEALREGFKQGHRAQLLYAPTGFGKCLAQGTPVIMYDGTIKKVEDIVVGDLLLSPEGEPRLVDGTVFGYDDMYEVMPTKGDPYIVNSSHILSLRMTGNKSRSKAGDGKFYQPNDIVNISIQDYLKSNQTFKHCAKGWRSDLIDFKIADCLPVDPYVLGLWLGDGTTKEPAITNVEPEIIAYIYKFAEDIQGRVSVWDNGNCKTYRICEGDFLSSMRSIGVIGNKHIPHQYKTASAEARRKLLAGIIDTDGYMFMDNFEITLKVKQLADDVCFVARSLGLAAYITQCTKTIKENGFFGTYYRITISGETDQIPCLVPRKKAKPRKINKNVRNVGIIVQHIGQGRYYGFSIAGDKKLFLLEDFTVTHNTEVAIHLMKATRDNYKRAAIVLDRLVLVDQTSLRLSKYKLPHGVMQAQHWAYDPAERLQVCSAQTLERRSKPLQTDLLIVDECFCAGTKIATPTGEIDIDKVRLGDVVLNQCGVGVVEAISVKPSTETYLLEFDDGTTTECTGNHPFFTPVGWKASRELDVGESFFSIEAVRLLWERVQTLDQEERCGESDVSIFREGMEQARNLLKILFKEIQKSDEQSSEQNENESSHQGNKAQTYQAWRQRAIATFASISPASRSGGGLGVGVCGGDKDEKSWSWLSNLLQDRHSPPGKENRNRSGRREPHNFSEKRSGQEEVRVSCFPRLVNISCVKRKSAVPVFNIQVSGHPSYFANGKLVHNCHITRKQTTDFIKANPSVKVIGLTATPFTKGLGDIYTNVVCGSTTGDLVEEKWLTPLKVFIAKEIDMTGAKKVAGEWAQDIVTERGMKITGDIVDEWVKMTHQVFGRPRKTIVFCAGVAHGADLVQQFAEKGYNFVSISYKDNDEFKKAAIEDFAKPDTEIHGLIATDILTRGFDVPDVMIGVSARPFSKSLSSHIQQMGRVMRPYPGKEFAVWLCLAKGSRVLTDKGLVPIEKVRLDHKIWDGTNFVSHGGAVCNGIQKVITYQGLTATEGHLVHTKKGWLTFGECARKQIRITQTGFGGTPIRIGEDLRSACFLAGRKAQTIYSCVMRMCQMWLQKLNFIRQFAKRQNKRLSCMQSTISSVSNVVIQQSASHESKMLFAIMRSISCVWRSWNRVQVCWGKAGNYLDYGKPWFAQIFLGGGSFSYPTGQNRSQRALRTWQSALDFSGIKPTQQAWQSSRGKDAQVQNGLPRNSILRQHIEAFFLGWDDGRTNSGTISSAIHKTEREVWDILNCGQHNRFTCEGLLVHNCHSGNFLRFREDWDEIYEDGVKALDGKVEKAKREPTEKQKKESKCPSCGHLWPKNSDTCPACGHVRQKRNQVEAVAGELFELQGQGKKMKDEKQGFYSELIYYAKERNYNHHWASHKYREKFGVWPRGLMDIPVPPSMKTLNWIKHKNIAWAKRQQRERA